MSILPTILTTPRLVLRPWQPADADRLHAILASNQDHLGPWIPRRVADPAPVPQLAERLDGFAADFEADREWRYTLVSAVDADLLGEIALFPRDAEQRVPFADANRLELGYWLRADYTGRGLVNEAVHRLLGTAAATTPFTRIEIRCDARNAASVAIPRRLGFTLESTIEQGGGELQVWISELSRFACRAAEPC